ncbi:hypothetical protein YPPY34_2217, partial [Yersinia pestis PY-34]
MINFCTSRAASCVGLSAGRLSLKIGREKTGIH